MSIWIVFKLLGSLALLMFGMKSMRREPCRRWQDRNCATCWEP